MNIGIYLNNLSDTDQLNHINNFVSESIKNKDVSDISIFYNEVGFNPHNIQCGMFNSTDLWSFNGNLIVTSLDALNTASRVVNNINIFYYYGWNDDKNVLRLISLLNNIQIISKSEKDDKEIYRLTGRKSIGISENFDDNIINLLLGYKDEYKSNNNDVYQTA